MFFVTALGLSVSGLYMEWIRGDRANMVDAIAISINAVLVIVFCVWAWRSAMAHQIAAHRRWTLRSYLFGECAMVHPSRRLLWCRIVISRKLIGIGESFDGPFFFPGVSAATRSPSPFLSSTCARKRALRHPRGSSWLGVFSC